MINIKFDKINKYVESLENNIEIYNYQYFIFLALFKSILECISIAEGNSFISTYFLVFCYFCFYIPVGT